MPLIIDTYNVTQTVGALPPELAGIGIRELIALIQASRYRREHVILACDGVPTSGRPGAVTGHSSHLIRVQHAGAGKSADDLIRLLISRSTIRRRLTIVSSDLHVLRDARRQRCRTIRSDDFLRQLARDHEVPQQDAEPARPQVPLSAESVRAWLIEFGLMDGDDELLADYVEALRPEDSTEPVAPPAQDVAPLDHDDALPHIAEQGLHDLIGDAEDLWRREAGGRDDR